MTIAGGKSSYSLYKESEAAAIELDAIVPCPYDYHYKIIFPIHKKYVKMVTAHSGAHDLF